MIDPIHISFTVEATPMHAFDTWVRRPEMWWPRSHTIGGADDIAIVFEEHVGGRIYQRTPDGVEHPWGEVTEWDPPHRISYLWHLFFDRSDATSITMTFRPEGDGTAVDLVQDGFDRLGDAGRLRRDRTDTAWRSVMADYRRFIDG